MFLVCSSGIEEIIIKVGIVAITILFILSDFSLGIIDAIIINLIKIPPMNNKNMIIDTQGDESCNIIIADTTPIMIIIM